MTYRQGIDALNEGLALLGILREPLDWEKFPLREYYAPDAELTFCHFVNERYGEYAVRIFHRVVDIVKGDSYKGEIVYEKFIPEIKTVEFKNGQIANLEEILGTVDWHHSSCEGMGAVGCVESRRSFVFLKREDAAVSDGRYFWGHVSLTDNHHCGEDSRIIKIFGWESGRLPTIHGDEVDRADSKWKFPLLAGQPKSACGDAKRYGEILSDSPSAR